MLNFLKNIFKFKGNYYFIGNGMTTYFNIAQILLSQIAAEKSIHSFRFSRPLFQDRDNKINFKLNMYKYFESLGWGPDFPGKIILIDSTTTMTKICSLMTLSHLLVEFLESKGMTLEEALKKVVPVTMPESSMAGQRNGPFRIDSILQNLEFQFNKFAEKLASKKKNFYKESDNLLYIYDNNLTDSIPFTYLYFPRWSTDSKFKFFDVDGIPQRNTDYTSIFNKNFINLERYKYEINKRIVYLAFYALIRNHFENIKNRDDVKYLIETINTEIVP